MFRGTCREQQGLTLITAGTIIGALTLATWTKITGKRMIVASGVRQRYGSPLRVTMPHDVVDLIIRDQLREDSRQWFSQSQVRRSFSLSISTII
jgi:hypothetical protein